MFFSTDPERKDARDTRVTRAWIGRGILGDGTGSLDPLVEIQAKLVDSSGIARRCKAFRGTSGVDSYAMLLTLADLDARGGQLDQAFEQVGGRSPTAFRVPEGFPGFVSFPVVSGVEQVDSVEEPR